MNTDMLSLRHKIQDQLSILGASVHGSGTHLESGVMDVSFTYQDTVYSLYLIKASDEVQEIYQQNLQETE